MQHCSQMCLEEFWVAELDRRHAAHRWWDINFWIPSPSLLSPSLPLPFLPFPLLFPLTYLPIPNLSRAVSLISGLSGSFLDTWQS